MTKLKRIHLFEIEDQPWFPNWIRDCMTKTINVMHKVVKTNNHLPKLLAKVLTETNTTEILDLCSGGGGPMVEAFEILKKEHGLENIQLEMTDLYPHQEFANQTNNKDNPNISYSLEPLDALNVPSSKKGLRTMICSFHHMRPAQAKRILKNAQDAQHPILIYEISDNKPPILLNFITIPIAFIICLFVTLKVRPITWQQIVFTYLIPIIPICFAWDGSVSNARTYTIKDMNKLIKEIQSPDYSWEPGIIEGKPNGKLYLIGKPVVN